LGRKFKRDGGAPMLPHDLTIAVSGGLILWFGWYGFNPGSTLSAMDFEGIRAGRHEHHPRAWLRDWTAMFWAYMSSKKWTRVHNQRIPCGLVAISVPATGVSPTGAILLGGIAACWLSWGELLEYLRIR